MDQMEAAVRKVGLAPVYRTTQGEQISQGEWYAKATRRDATADFAFKVVISRESHDVKSMNGILDLYITALAGANSTIKGYDLPFVTESIATIATTPARPSSYSPPKAREDIFPISSAIDITVLVLILLSNSFLSRWLWRLLRQSLWVAMIVFGAIFILLVSE